MSLFDFQYMLPYWPTKYRAERNECWRSLAPDDGPDDDEVDVTDAGSIAADLGDVEFDVVACDAADAAVGY